MKIKQARLRATLANGKALEALTLTTWLDVRPELKVGAEISLKGYDGIKWTVVELYDQEHDSSDFDWHRKWDNNI